MAYSADLAAARSDRRDLRRISRNRRAISRDRRAPRRATTGFLLCRGREIYRRCAGRDFARCRVQRCLAPGHKAARFAGRPGIVLRNARGGMTRALSCPGRDAALLQRCFAEPGPYHTPLCVTAPALQRTASQVLRAALRPGHE